MKTTKKIISLLLVVVMILGMIPAVIANTADKVYISVSYDGKYIDGQNGAPIAYIPVSFDEIASVDLEIYGLGEYLYDEDGDEVHETTALQLVIYAHENIYGGDWSDVTFTGAPGSSYFQGGIFGFDENLNYYLNGEYPLAGEGWGATSDQIVLEAGDFIDIASFSSWDFFQDSNYGFHFFADEHDTFTHTYAAEAETALPIKLVRSYSGMGTDASVFEEAGYEIHYGTALYQETGNVTTDDSGCAEITFPTAGKWYLWADGNYGYEYPDSIVSAPAYAEVTVDAAAAETPREPQDVSAVLNATMAEMATTVTEPVFGTTAGEWTVLSLARGGYYAKNHAYFSDYYNRIVETVNETAASVNLNGALHKNKSTENSRLIVALSAIGKNATSVGKYDLVEAYSANGYDWIKKQGLNGTIWALIALDSNNYETSDATIRQTCVDALVAAQHDDGGWSLMANTALASDPDVTGMALTALYPYRDQPAVAEVCDEAFGCLSAMQHENGTFASGGSECAESCAWVIVACTTWGINPDTDSRFVKNGNSAVDGLLAHYMEEEAMFQHIVGAGTNAIATDQSCYALVAYHRFINNQPTLFDYSDVTFDAVTSPENPEDQPTESPVLGEMTATLGLPEKVEVGKEFNAVISVSGWNNDVGYKLLDFIAVIPDGVSVTSIAAGNRLSGGQITYNLEASTGKLRVVYFDANNFNDLTVSGTENPAEVAVITMQIQEPIENETIDFSITGMSAKRTSDSADEAAMTVVDTTSATATVEVVAGISYSAVCLYQGDDVDLIPATKKAVAIAITGVDANNKLTFKYSGKEIPFCYSKQISDKSGITTYVALVDASIAMEEFVKEENIVLTEGTDDGVTFGDSNSDGVVNAQDALAAVDAWLRKGNAPEDLQILTLNVNGDSRINTFDAIGIMEAFVDGSDYGVVTKAATITTQQ